MPKSLLLASLILASSQAYAAESWLDSALDFFGFGDDKEEVMSQPANVPEPEAKTLTEAATSVLTSKAVTTNLTTMVTNQLGVTNSQAQGGLGSLFSLAQTTLGSQEFKQLSSAIPEMDTLLSAAPAISENTEGLSSLLGSAGKYGKALQGATQAYSQFKALGISVDQIPGYISVTNEFLKSQGSDDAMTLFQKGVAALLADEP